MNNIIEYNETIFENIKHIYEYDNEFWLARELQKVASKAGVKNMAEFHNAGYKELYRCETANDIFKRMKLRYRIDF